MSILLGPAEWPTVCPRWLHTARPTRKCLKPLQDYKCPQHGLIREAMPK